MLCRHKGFTLIELLLVIAVFILLFALVVPAARIGRHNNIERNASACLKVLATAEIDFRANDRDGNRINDFWTYDVKGLYTVETATVSGNKVDWQASGASPIKLIEEAVAAADNFTAADFTAHVKEDKATTAAYRSLRASLPLPSAPHNGYWFYALRGDKSGGKEEAYAEDTDGTGVRCHKPALFGFAAYPDTPKAGKSVFMINEGATVIRFPGDGVNKTGTSIPPNSFPATKAGSPDLATWPTDAELKSYYSRLD